LVAIIARFTVIYHRTINDLWAFLALSHSLRKEEENDVMHEDDDYPEVVKSKDAKTGKWDFFRRQVGLRSYKVDLQLFRIVGDTEPRFIVLFRILLRDFLLKSLALGCVRTKNLAFGFVIS